MVDAYNTRFALDRLLWHRLDKSLASIAAEVATHDEAVFSVLKAAEQQGWLGQLVSAAVEGQPENVALSRWAKANLRSSDRPSVDASIPIMLFDLNELRRIAGEAITELVELTWESAEIYLGAAVFAASRQGIEPRVLLRVESTVPADSSEKVRFGEEVERASYAAAHSRVADLVSSGFTAAGYPYIVQRVDQGVSRFAGPLSVDGAIEIGANLADALAVAHNRGSTFGPIRSSHILLTADGAPILTFPQLPMFAPAGLTLPTPQQDVSSLCETLQSMLEHPYSGGAQAEEIDTGSAETKLRSIFAAAIQGRLIAAALRDQLETLKRDSAPGHDGPRTLAAAPTNGSGRSVEDDVVLVMGDLFDEQADLVVGFSDTFDTATSGSAVISPSSLQGQLVDRVFHGDVAALDAALDRALAAHEVAVVETREAKNHGKLNRYPVGTVAVLEHDRRRIYAVALSQLQNDLLAVSDPDFIRLSLQNLWPQVRRHGRGRALAMPIIGSGLARLTLSREELADMILSSYREHARVAPVCRELRIIVHPSDAARFELPRTEFRASDSS